MAATAFIAAVLYLTPGFGFGASLPDRYGRTVAWPLSLAGGWAGIEAPSGAEPLQYASPAAVPAYRAWSLPAPVDQGPEQCVGYAWATWAMSTPDPANPAVDGAELYAAAKRIDGMPPGSTGTYMPVGAEVLKERHVLAWVSYTRSVDDVRSQILDRGPVVLDTPWYSGMEYPDAKTGYAHPMGSSGDRYHAYVCYGFYSAGPNADSFRCRNSQGAAWGLQGDFLITGADLQLLFDQGGDAAVAEKAGQ